MALVQRQTRRRLDIDHEGFLRHRRFIWLKRAAAVCLVALLAYALAEVEPRHNGGTWLGYTLGTIGTGLIVWLALLGVRKRNMSRGGWSLKAWTSAHVYLGLALIVIATLHTGFQFGWNVHTLAYVLMMLVIASGVFGIVAYSALPVAISTNREEMTQPQMVEALAAVDRQLESAAQPMDRRWADLVAAALDEDALADGVWRRLSARQPRGATLEAIASINRASATDSAEPALARLEALLQRRQAQLARMRRHMRLKALIEVWLYVHVPATFALLAALAAHIVSVFYYW
jgi:enamine deaminase RidA (YjgF/YER057c/UK114 family)